MTDRNQEIVPMDLKVKLEIEERFDGKMRQDILQRFHEKTNAYLTLLSRKKLYF